MIKEEPRCHYILILKFSFTYSNPQVKCCCHHPGLYLYRSIPTFAHDPCDLIQSWPVGYNPWVTWVTMAHTRPYCKICPLIRTCCITLVLTWWPPSMISVCAPPLAFTLCPPPFMFGFVNVFSGSGSSTQFTSCALGCLTLLAVPPNIRCVGDSLITWIHSSVHTWHT